MLGDVTSACIKLLSVYDVTSTYMKFIQPRSQALSSLPPFVVVTRSQRRESQGTRFKTIVCRYDVRETKEARISKNWRIDYEYEFRNPESLLFMLVLGREGSSCMGYDGNVTRQREACKLKL